MSIYTGQEVTWYGFDCSPVTSDITKFHVTSKILRIFLPFFWSRDHEPLALTMISVGMNNYRFHPY